MLIPRVIPCLLLKNGGLVKTIKFKNPTYVGDPINAVKIFNDKEVDELIFLDITATEEKRRPAFKVIADIASECFMPLAYGGGIRSMDDAKEILTVGAEKIVINSYAFENPDFVSEIATRFGSQSVVVSIDVKKTLFGRYHVVTSAGTHNTGQDPVEYAREMEKRGAGEIFLTAIDREGTGEGYDYKLIELVSKELNIPVIACGGAATVPDLVAAVTTAGAAAVAAGSMFVFHGRHRAVLINFPERATLEKSFLAS